MNGSAHRHGRTASQPGQIPWRGWWDIAVRVKERVLRDNASLISAGLAMYALLAVFPALAAIVSLYGLLVSPQEVVRQISGFAQQMPPDVWNLLKTQLQAVASHQHGTLGASAAVGFLVALWSTGSGMSSLMTATNIAYGEHERRGFFRQLSVALLLTVGALIGFVLMVALAFAVPVILGVLGNDPWLQICGEVARWLLLWCFALFGLAVVYRLGPSREPARWRWLTWGSAIASTLWLIGTVLLTLYVRLFASYQKTYGALGGVVVMLMWFYLSSFFVLLGAEIDSEAERQTVKDTTTGPAVPMGRRGAYAADTIGPTSEEAHRDGKMPPLAR
jgi:membrane protein